MANENSTSATTEEKRPKSLVPHVLISLLVGVLFVLAVGLVLLLPSMTVIYLVDRLEIGGISLDLSWIIALWGLSAVLTVAGYFLIQGTFIREVLNRHVVSPGSEEILDQ